MKKSRLLLQALCLSLTMFSAPSQGACLPWNSCFYPGALDFFKQMADSAGSVGNAAVRGDIDAVANGVIDQLTNAGPFGNAMFAMVADIAPGQVGQYVRVANDLRARVEQEANGLRAQTYRNLYATYKNDASTLISKLKEGNLSFSEYYRYNFYYAVATADWSNPDAMKASATRIAEDQYAAYSWYSSHTLKGAAIGTARNRVGLTDEAIKQGVRELAEEIKANKDLGKMGAIILAHFATVASTARNEVIGNTRTACERTFTGQDNIEFCVQRCLPRLNAPDSVAACAAGTPPIINVCRGTFTDPNNQSTCLTRCKDAQTQRDLALCSNASASAINACGSYFTDPNNRSSCIKRCFGRDDRTCMSEAAEMINACDQLFSAQTNKNYCKEHCVEVAVGQIDACRRHAAEMINTGRREPFVGSR